MTQKLTTPVCIFFLSLAGHSIAQGQWVQTNGLYSRSIEALAVNGTNLFAATPDSGVFLSTDNGMSWAPVNDLNETGGPKDAYAVAVYGTYLFAGTDNGGIFLSTNDGKSWTLTRNETPGAGVVETFAASGTNIFAGAFGGGIYRSTDNGSSWLSVDSGLQYGVILSLAFSGTNLFAGSDAYGIFLSTDSGSVWNTSGLDFLVVLSLAVSDTNIFAGTSNGLFLSTDSGTSWNAVNSDTAGDIYSLFIIGTNIFSAGDRSGIYLSTDNGTSWVSVNDGLPSPPAFYHYVVAFASDGTYLYAGTTDMGVWRRPLSEMIPFNDVAQYPSANFENALRVFPNPARDALQVLGGPSGTARLFDLLGRERAQSRDDGSGTQLDISHLEPGVYFLRIGNQSAKVEIAH